MVIGGEILELRVWFRGYGSGGTVVVNQVVSVSLGSSSRDARAEVDLLGERLSISRIGTDGDFQLAISLIRSLDGWVDAIGLGGVNHYLRLGARRWALRDGVRLARAAARTPVVDGSGLKDMVDGDVVADLEAKGIILFAGQRVLVTSVLDRFELTMALARAGASIVIGDPLLALGLPFTFPSLSTFGLVASLTMPVLSRLPIGWLYPTGGSALQRKTPSRGVSRFIREARVLAGDFHLLRRHLPPDLRGKAVIASTLTAEDVGELLRRGAGPVVSLYPSLYGRCFGANVMEALLAVLARLKGLEPGPATYRHLWGELGFEPSIFT